MAKTEAVLNKGGIAINLDEYIVQIKANKIKGIKNIEKITDDSANVTTEEGYMFIITVNSVEYYENENNLPEMNIKDANIEFAFEPDTWTNGNVKVTVSKKESKYVIQLSKDAESWTTANIINFDENGTLYVRLKDPIGRVSDYASRKISIIDTEKPVVTSATPSTNSVRIKATDDAAGITGYAVTTIDIEPTEFTKCDSTKSLDVTVENLTQGTAYYAWVKDAAGNVSASKSTDTGTVTELTISTDTANWSTSKTITITATNSNYSNIRYTTDETIPTSTTGTAYTEPFTITSNCTITAVAFDSTGQAGSTATNKVTTIDTAVPTISTALSGTGTTNSITLSMGVSDSQSGTNKIIWYYKLSDATSYTNATDTYTATTSTVTKTHTFTGLEQNKTYNAYAVVYDATGRTKQSSTINVTTGTVTELTITANTANWSTSKTITITAANSNYSNIRYTTDGTIPTSTTGTAYTEPFKITSNCTITAVAFDSEGQAGSTATNKITKVDTAVPKISTALSGTGTTNSITLSMEVSDSQSGTNKIIWYYKLSDATSYTNATDTYTATTSTVTKTHTFTGLEQNKTYNAYAVVYDAVGRKKQSSTINVTTGTVTELTISTNTANWSTSKTITITAADNNYSNIRYTTDGTIPTSTTGTEYTAAFKITSNCTITAVAFDSEGQAGSTATNKITKVDTAVPKISTALSGTGTTNSITLSMGVSDSQSGTNKIIWYYKLSDATSYTNETDTYTATTSTVTKTHTFTGLEQNKTYNAYAVVYDVTGRKKQSSTIEVKTVPVDTASGATYTPSEWTNGDVAVTLPTRDGYSTLYTTDGTKPTNASTKYTSAITLKNNTTIYYVYSDGTNIGGAGTVNVTNIDKEKPVIKDVKHYESINNSANSGVKTLYININLIATDDKSGINGYAISYNTTMPTTFSGLYNEKYKDQEFSHIMESGMDVNITGKDVYIWVKDAAGNISNYKKSDLKTVYSMSKIGDYVNYDATSKYTYTSVTGTGSSHGNGYSGTTSSTGSGSTTSYSQKFTSSSSIKWRVLSKDTSTGEVVLISESPIKTDAGSNFRLNGAIGYLYAEEELNKICSIYGYGNGANTSKTFSYVTGDLIEGTKTGTLTGSGARSINVDDVNKICGVTPSSTLDSYYGKAPYTKSIYYPTTSRATGKSTSAAIRTDVYTEYSYKASNYLANTTEVYKMLFRNTANSSNIEFWLASRCVYSYHSSNGFKIRSVSDGGVFYRCLGDGNISRFDDYSYGSGVRPIVYLKSNIQTRGQDSDGAWNIISE